LQPLDRRIDCCVGCAKDQSQDLQLGTENSLKCRMLNPALRWAEPHDDHHTSDRPSL
jgi:hypothetical protein